MVASQGCAGTAGTAAASLAGLAGAGDRARPLKVEHPGPPIATSLATPLAEDAC